MSILHHAIPNDPYYNNVVLHLRGYDAQSGQVFKDYSKYNRTISVFGNTSHSTTQKKYGDSSIYFDGSGDYLSINDSEDFNFGTGDFTIEVWTQPSFTNSIKNIITKRNSYIRDQSFSLNTAGSVAGGLSFYGGNNNPLAMVTSFVLPQNQFNYISVIRNLNTIILSCNGNNIGSSSFSGAFYTSTANIVVGRAVDYTPEDFLGYIEGLRITKGIARPIAVPTQPFSNF